MGTFSLLFACSFVFSILINSATSSIIYRSQSIRDGDTAVSAGGSFELGFFSPGSSEKRYLGIWYKKSPRTVLVFSNESSSGESSGSKDKKTESGEAAAETKEKRIKDAKALSIIQGALTDDIFPRIRNEETTRGAWDLLRREFRGDDKVREVKLQAVRAEFEKHKSIVSIIEETRDLKTLRSEEVIASIKVYDRREDMHDERDREMHTERAFSSLKIGGNSYAQNKKGSQGRNYPKLQNQNRCLQIRVKVEVLQICKITTGIKNKE
uniref:Uncharacterized protein n=1 Tax=Salix viminalis TaxID=40686 RepID=A0A6N2N8W9_SALVM